MENVPKCNTRPTQCWFTVKLLAVIVTGLISLCGSIRAARATSAGDILYSGAVLFGSKTDSVDAPNGRVKLVMQGDCNLVAKQGGNEVWSTHTAGQGANCVALMQADGTLVVRRDWSLSTGGVNVWSSPTAGNQGARLVAQWDGNITIVSGNRPIWTISKQIQAPYAGCWFDGQDSAVRVCGIYKPTVTQRITPYQDIKFYPGDHVHVIASGCVQTGGIGDTWKRYVDPTGKDTDKYYHGQIWIPGAIDQPAGLERIQNINNDMVVVGPGVESDQSYLRLGYEDEDGQYGNNGYDEHDNGNDDQCKDVGPAQVVLLIGPDARVGGKTVIHKDMDLVTSSSGLDGNAIPVNPTWYWYKLHQQKDALFDPVHGCSSAEFSDCTTQNPAADTIDNSFKKMLETDVGFGLTNGWVKLCHDSGYPLWGHLNWFPGTYIGKINFHSHDGGLGGDDDYNWDLLPTDDSGNPSNAGLIVGNGGKIHVEFDSDESIDHFTQADWKYKLRYYVDHGVDAELAKLNGALAIVTGLVGVDFVHDPQVELHPAWAFSLRISADASTDKWLVMIRNFGDEGMCSTDQHYLDLLGDRFRVRLPWREGATGVSALPDLETASGSGVQATQPKEVVVNGKRFVELQAVLPSPESHTWLDGVVTLQWSGAPSAPAPPPRGALSEPGARQTPTRQLTVNTPPQNKDESLVSHDLIITSGGTSESTSPQQEVEPEDLYLTFVNHLTPSQRQIYVLDLGQPAARSMTHPHEGNFDASPPDRAPAARHVFDQTRPMQIGRKIRALCDAYGKQDITIGQESLPCSTLKGLTVEPK